MTKTSLAHSGLLALALAAAPTGWAADAAIEKVTVRAVAHFGFDRAALDPADQARILAEVGKMQDVSWQSVVAVGHTDSVGPAAYNEDLSARRAEAVRAYLLTKGLAPTMVSTVAKAATAPAADNDSAAGRAKNRRTEIEFRGVRTASR